MASTATGGIDRVRNWLMERHPGRRSIGTCEDLIASRIVDSLAFVEFVFVIEDASGVQIDQETIDLDNFRTLAAIQKKYFS